MIADDVELPRVEPSSSRARRVPGRDYSYQDFENLIAESINDEAGPMLSHKRKRTRIKEPSALVPVPR